MSVLTAISSSSYLQQLTGAFQTGSSSAAQKPQGGGPPPPPPGGGSRAGGEVKSALEEQGLDEESLEAIRVEIEAALADFSETGSTDSANPGGEITAILEEFGVDVQELSADLAELRNEDAYVGEQAAGQQSASESYAQNGPRPRLGVGEAVLQSLFAFDAEA